MIYLAAPYAHLDARVRAHRAYRATLYAGALLSSRQPVFSPLTQGHQIHLRSGLVKRMTHDDWLHVDMRILARCDEVHVLMLEGWEQSKGVEKEVALAERIGLPIKYISNENFLSVWRLKNE